MHPPGTDAEAEVDAEAGAGADASARWGQNKNTDPTAPSPTASPKASPKVSTRIEEASLRLVAGPHAGRGSGGIRRATGRLRRQLGSGGS